MERYICIHGHFYQPPRENPWLEVVERQDSAYPYHDWNERITEECYASNATSRVLSEKKQIVKISNNYAKISFNFGPTLLSWLEEKFPSVYQAILQADKESSQRFEGHGNAIAQAYNHTILPLSNSRDKYTQIVWGIADFVQRFQRQPQGLWLPETAVDLESLAILADQGIKFTILAQHQAKRIRQLGSDAWHEIQHGQIDPTIPYLLKLPHDRSIAIFFYDGAVSQAVAFSVLLNKGETLAESLMKIFDEHRHHAQLAHIATDGETYGHHHPHGNMALAYALDHIETENLAKLTNYSQFLQKFPPPMEVEIIENSSWSCIHGIERWRSACGCHSGGKSDWHQQWRAPLRETFDWLRDQLIEVYQTYASPFFNDPWEARNAYIQVVLQRRSPKILQQFFNKTASRELTDMERQSALCLLEMQRHAMLMYTSCGWFFDELSGIETLQVIRYATRATQLAEKFLGKNTLEKTFSEKLAQAKSNLQTHGDGHELFEKIIKPCKLDWYPGQSLFRDEQRIVIEQVWPEIDNGRFPIKRCLNDRVTVEAVIFAEGHDELAAILQYRHNETNEWEEIPFKLLDNDRWQATFPVNKIGNYYYTIHAWIDRFQSWRHDLIRWLDSNEDITVQLLIGAELITAASQRAPAKERQRLQFFAESLKNSTGLAVKTIALDPELYELMRCYAYRENNAMYAKELAITVDRDKAGFSSWYEVFPRSLSNKAHQHGSLADLIAHLPYIAEMGFDVIYLPPIHPIGHQFRKGKNNAPVAQVEEPGSPWGIGSNEGGHIAIHPQLGNFNDFQLLINKAKEYQIEIALDLALQCTPDHPYVTQYPQWFKRRPDGTIQYAENPPKKYQDIYPLNFHSEQRCELWQECLNIVLFWIKKGVRIFRVDNPHTKPFNFWEWLITQVKSQYPEVLFLAEAFTRPNIMYFLAKLGFSQSYTYFTWRNTKNELMTYLTELNHSIVNQFFRPNFWPNTPDILPEYLQTGGRPAFIIRLILAATLSSNYGIYGPAYELCVNTAREPQSEEYLNSEKYEIISWNLNQENSIKNIITQINKIRRENLCLQSNQNLKFHHIDNPQLIAYSKSTEDKKNIIIIVVNLDAAHPQTGWLHLSPADFGITANHYVMRDLLDNSQYHWQDSRNYIELDPQKLPAHIFNLEIL